MITKAPSFVTSDQQTFLTLEAAQGHELGLLPAGPVGSTAPEWVMQNKEKIVDILTMKVSSRPRARKINKKKLIVEPTAK